MSRNTLPGPFHFIDNVLDSVNKEQRKNYKYNQLNNQKPIKFYNINGAYISEDAIKNWYPWEADRILKQNKPINIENITKKGLVPPPFKYLGPGNSLNRGNPYNQIDADAKEHDEAYNQAIIKEDIRRADSIFINKAGDHIVEGIAGKSSISDTIGAIAGGIGIGAKNIIEKATGNIHYPSNLSGKQ